MLPILIEVIGWTGAVSLLAAYALISAGKLANDDFRYQFLNVIGALGFIVNGLYHGAYPSAAMNTIWMLIAVVFIVRLGRERRSSGSPAPKR